MKDKTLSTFQVNLLPTSRSKSAAGHFKMLIVLSFLDVVLYPGDNEQTIKI
jgi:hypothetical protein